MSIVPSEKYNMAGHGADRREPSRYLRHSGHKFFALICFLFLSFIIIADSARAQNSDAFMADLFHAKESQIGFFQIDLGLPDTSSRRDVQRHYMYAAVFSEIIGKEVSDKSLKCRSIITKADYPFLSGFWYSNLPIAPPSYTVSRCAEELARFIAGLEINVGKVHSASLRVYKRRILSEPRDAYETYADFYLKQAHEAVGGSVLSMVTPSHPAHAILSVKHDGFKYFDRRAFLEWFHKVRSRGTLKILTGKERRGFSFDSSLYFDKTTVKATGGSLIIKQVRFETSLPAMIVFYLHPRLQKNSRADHPVFSKYCSNSRLFKGNPENAIYKCTFFRAYLGMGFAGIYLADYKKTRNETIKALDELAQNNILKDAAAAGEEHGFGSAVLVEFIPP